MQLVHLRHRRQSAVSVLELDRPDARNAYSTEMVESLVHALHHEDRDPEVRAIVLTGRGPAFHAGGDLKAMRESQGMFAGGPSELRNRYIEGIQGVPRALAAVQTPVVAAIGGPAIGAGLDLACMCDIRIAARSAKLGATFVKVGLVPGDGGAYFLARTIGFARALEMVLTGRIVDAEQAERIGLVHRVVDDDALLSEALAYAQRLADLSPVAVQLTKRAAYRSWNAELETALELACTYQGIAQTTDEHREAVRRLLEGKRP